MSHRFLRLSTILYPLAMLLCGLGYARWDGYQMDGDAVSFLNIADAIQKHHWALVANGYWNPAYAFALALGNMAAHPARWHALQINFYVNFVIFALAIAVVTFFVYALLRFREDSAPGKLFALPAEGLLLFAWAVTFYSWQRELSIGKVRSDGLLFVFFILAAALVLRFFTTGRLWYAAALGLALGGSYLTKSFGFVASLCLLALLLLALFVRRDLYGKKMLAGVLLAAFLFLLTSAPYIAAISRQRSRLTFGDSSRLLYAWFVDGMDSAHAWHTGRFGSATEQLKHHERLLSDHPAVYSYDEHLDGTFPLWFDPAWWHDKTTPRFAFVAQAHVLARNIVLDARFLEGHLEPLLFLSLLLLCGCCPPARWRPWTPCLLLAAWSLCMAALYSLLILQDRYLSVPWFLVLVPLAASLRVRDTATRNLTVALVLLLAGLSLSDAVRDLAQRRRTLSWTTATGIGAYDSDIYSAAHGLVDFGIRPGDRVACIGLYTCGTDPYWAWLAGAQMVADVDDDRDAHAAFWNDMPNKRTVVRALESVHAKALVLRVQPGEDPPPDWQRLGAGSFFAYPIPSPLPSN